MPLSSAKNNQRAAKVCAWLICLALMLVAGLVVGREILYLRNLTVAPPTAAQAVPVGWPEEHALNAADIKGLDKPVHWNGQTLSDKINGKAELYLAAGFKGMVSARFAMQSNLANWFEVQLFEQDSAQNAFAVFSQQRRSQGVPISWSSHGYLTSNGLYLRHGSFYLEVSAVNTQPELKEAMVVWAKRWLQGQEVGQELDPVAAFAGDGLKASSILLLAQDAFGLAGFNDVWVAEYEKGGHGFMLFMHLYEQEQAARQWQERLCDFWLLQGAMEVSEHNTTMPGLQVFELEGMYQIIWRRDGYLLGVHEAPSLDEAILLLGRLADHLARK